MMRADFAALLPAEPLPPDAAAAEDAQARSVEARAVRDRLPNVMRAAPPRELEKRVRDPRLLVAAKEWRWRDGNLLLLGPTRCGKTTAAAYLFRRLLAQGVRAAGTDWELAQNMAWFGAEELLAAHRTHPLGKGDAPEFATACRASVLFLDDAGWDRDPAVVSSVLNARYESGLFSIITTGKTSAELTAHYGAAVVRRMIECGGNVANVVDCFPKDAT